jgi:hypothetical protein
MPYLRVYSRGLEIDKKRVIAQRLMEITLRTFHLPPEQRNRMNVQFVSESQTDRDSGLAVIPDDADYKLEVLIHHPTESGKRAFCQEAATTFAELEHPTAWQRITSMLGLRSASEPRVVLQFDELSPAVSDPFIVQQERMAA